MPQFNPHNYMNPNPEVRKYNGEYWLFEPTKVQDSGAGFSYGTGGKATRIGALNGYELFQQYGLYPGDVFNATIDPTTWMANAKYSPAEFKSNIENTFSQMDPNNVTGWRSKVDALAAKASSLYDQDPNQMDKIFGTVWNQFRYDPANATAINTLMNPNPRPEFTSQTQADYYAATGQLLTQEQLAEKTRAESTSAGTGGSSSASTGSSPTTSNPAATPAATPVTASQINFKSGLTEAQKTSIVNLMNRTTPLNETDARNYAFATGTNFQQWLGKTPQEILGLNTSQTGTSSGNAPTAGLGQNSLVPGEIEANPLYQSLSQDQKTLIGLAYQASTASTAEQKQKLNEALAEAIKVVDPMMREQIRLVQDELNRNVGSINADAKSSIDATTERIRQIKEDLTYNKEQLSLDQQAELSSQLRDHENKLYEMQQSMAESGLAFSSPRSRAEQLLKSDYQDMSESTMRKYNRANRTNDIQSARDIAQLEKNIQDLERGRGEKLTSLSRSSEEKLGSNNLPAVTGVNPLGGITGSIEQNRQRLLAGLESDFSIDNLKNYLS